MATPDKDFDRWIMEALNAEIGCSRSKRQTAWVEIAQKAKQQPVLAPTEAIASPLHTYATTLATCRRLWNWFTALASDETRYDRARLNRHRMYHLSAIGDGSISVQILEPLHYRWMSPT